MRFHPSDEQRAIQDVVRGTLADGWAPRLGAFVDTTADFDAESWDALMALGLGGLMVPEAAGGAGLGLVDAALAIEMTGEAAAAGPIAAQMIAAMAVAGAADETVKHYLPGLIDGSVVATLAFSGAWLPESWDVTVSGGMARGTVSFVQAGSAATLFVVGTAGGGLALVERSEAVRVAPVSSTDHTRRLATVTFDGAPALMLAPPGDPLVARVFDAALVLSAAEALGGAQHCLDLSVAYARQREQFGQPIGRFQALKHQLATMALEVEPARALLWYAAYAFDSGLPDARRTAALAKAHIADRFVSVARAAVAAHGGIGYTWEYGLVTWFRRSVFDSAWLGSPAVHRARAADLAGW